MSNLIFISGDFSSGSTLLFTLFRKTNEFCCLFEPLHQNLPEFLIWSPRVYEHHFFVEDYFWEYKGFTKIPALHKRRWGLKKFCLSPEEKENDLYRYLSYLVGTAFGRHAKVVLKFNRATFRLGWLRAKFPQAKIVNIYRNREDQWNSIVRRVQTHFGREDGEQEDVMFNGFNIADWCEDLKTTFPQLDARASKTGYDRYCKLYELSGAENERYADVSIDYWELTHNFETTCERIWEIVECTADIAPLKQFVILPEKQKPLPVRRSGIKMQLEYLLERAGRRYSKSVVAVRTFLRESR
jgi:hypothetical protein